ncbi:MAG: hypothetical protein HC769_30270 [Cyanobacteria bacterium CRU_2_1]|nr:hypothetical protein [Cyanobacteria bacterium CRU_2_1]
MTKELALKEKELALKEQEVKAKIELERRGVWFSSPLLIGIASAIFGLLGTGIGAALQGYSNSQLERQKYDSNFQLERQKFEFSLIQKALEIKDRNEAAKQLMFLVDSGVIQSLDSAKIRKIAEQPNQLPSALDISIKQRDVLKECVITISNPLVSLKNQPDTFSLDLVSVKPGTYPSSEHVFTSSSQTEEGWFKIKYEGRNGWIGNNTWSIESKSNSCP